MELPRRDLSAADLADDALIAMGQDTFRQEADGLHQVADSLDGRFAAAVRCLLACSGRVLVTGLGKSGIMARIGPWRAMSRRLRDRSLTHEYSARRETRLGRYGNDLCEWADGGRRSYREYHAVPLFC